MKENDRVLESVIRADGRYYGKRVGTVKKGFKLHVLLFVPRVLLSSNVSMVICPDGGEKQTIDLTWSKVEGYLDLFECYFRAEQTGLYWYHFETDTPHGKRFSRIDSGRVSFEQTLDESFNLQLTVYERKYPVPDFIKGGLIYQIFPDRFYKGSVTGNQKSAESTGDISKNVAFVDPIKEKYHLRDLHDEYDNRLERSIVLRNDWGGEPLWEADRHGDILNNDFFGGNLKGIREKLSYLKSLGVTCIYLNPIFEAYSNHRYDTGDYEKVDPLLGDEKEFAILCAEAKSLDIAIVLDGVFNHTGDDSIYFNRYGTYAKPGAWQSEDSVYRDWYEWKDNLNFNSWWGIKSLPTTNKDSKGYRGFLFGKNGVIRKWIRLGASGWRLDVVDELPGEFLRKVIHAAKAEKSDALIIGEVWEDASNKVSYGVRRTYFQGEELDSCMNYPWKNAIISYLRDRNCEGLYTIVSDICANYPPDILNCLMNPLGTHDSVRILTALSGPNMDGASRSKKHASSLSEAEYRIGIRLLKLAVLIQMLLPGVPSIYYGDEVGMEGYNDPFNRRCYPWGKENLKLREWFRALGNFRASHREFFGNADLQVLKKNPGNFIFRRSFGGLSLLCIVNRAKEDFEMTLLNKWRRYEGLADPKACGAEDVFCGTIETDKKGMLKTKVPADFGYILLVV